MLAPALVLAVALLQAGPVLPLDEALREAGTKNLDLAQARARLEQVRAGERRAWAGQLPQVSAGATYTRNSEEATVELPTGFAVRDTGAVAGPPAGGALPGAPTAFIVVPTDLIEATIQERDQLAAQIQATQALFAPAIWYAIGAARRGSEVATENVEASRQDVLFAVAQTYYGAVSARKAVAVQERQLAIAVEHERDAKVRFEAGTVPKVTVLRAEIDRTQAEQDLTRLRNLYQSAKISLATLLDRPDVGFEVDVPGAPEVPPEQDQLEETALGERPDVRAAEANVALQRASRRSTAANYLPTLGAFARWQVSNASGFTGQRDSWAAGLAASWNVFDGGLREAQLREGSARIAEAEAAQRGAENRVRDEVRRARLDLESALANRVKASEQAVLARENQRLIEVNFQAGAATYLEVSDANLALASAELGLVSESLNADLSALRLLKAAGRFAR